VLWSSYQAAAAYSASASGTYRTFTCETRVVP
jgi:hypothetical protein